MKDRLLNDKIHLTFITLTVTAIHYCLLAWKISEFWVPPDSGTGARAKCKCDTGNITHVVDDACQDVCPRLNLIFRQSSPLVQAKPIYSVRSMIRRRIHSTGTGPAMLQPQNDQDSVHEDFLDSMPEELIEQPNNSLKHLSCCVAATEAWMRFSAVLPIGGSTIAHSSHPVPCSNSNSNDITNITSIENTGYANGSMNVEGALLLGG